MAKPAKGKTREDRDVFLSALDNPPAPTETLRNAFKLHDARVVKEKVREGEAWLSQLNTRSAA